MKKITLFLVALMLVAILVVPTSCCFHFCPCLDRASIDVECHISVDHGETWDDADNPNDPAIAEWRTPLKFKYIVTNTGDVTLTNITLTDDTWDVSSIAMTDPLPAGASFEGAIGYERPFCWSVEGLHTNTATATGDYSGVTYSDTDTTSYFGQEQVE